MAEVTLKAEAQALADRIVESLIRDREAFLARLDGHLEAHPDWLESEQGTDLLRIEEPLIGDIVVLALAAGLPSAAGEASDGEAVQPTTAPAFLSEGAPTDAFRAASRPGAAGPIASARRVLPGPLGPQLVIVELRMEGLAKRAEVLRNSIGRGSPQFSTRLLSPPITGPTPAARLAQRPLDPWAAGRILVVELGDEVPLGAIRQRNRILRLSLIALLLSVILAGILIITRAVGREVEVARLKSDFVANVSHELRTPITTIRIMAEMLSLGAVPSGDKQGEYYRNIVSEAERLSRLINNVLDFARIEEGRKKFDFGLGDIGDMIYEVERIIGDYVRKEGFEFEVSVDGELPPVRFDRDAIVQALINLVSNAVKYSEETRSVALRAALDRDSIRLSVADRGAGIDAKEIPHLFEKFYRGGDHMTREVGGTGLGLAIVQHIVLAHDGRIDVESVKGEGSTFTITLPVASCAPGTEAGT